MSEVVRPITFKGKKYNFVTKPYSGTFERYKVGDIIDINRDSVIKKVGVWNEATKTIDFDKVEEVEEDDDEEDDDDEVIRKDADETEEIERVNFDKRFPINDPNKRPLVSLPLPEKFVLTPKEEKLYEANKELFKRRFKDYLTKSRTGTVIFYQESDEIQKAIWKMIDAKKWNNGSGRPLMSRIDEIEYKLDDMKKELDTADSPETKKMIMRMMRQIAKQAPEANRLDDIYDELVRQYWERRNMKDAENETKRYLKEVEDKRLRDIENEKRRIASEAQRKRNEEVQTQRAREKAETEMMGREEAPQQKLRAKERNLIDKIDTSYKKIAFYDDRVTEGKVIRRVTKPVTSIKVDDFIELQNLLKRLTENPTSFDTSILKKNIEDDIDRLKMPSLVEGMESWNTFKSMITNPTRWEGGGNDETKSGIKRRDEFVAEATKSRFELAGKLKQYYTSDEIRTATELLKQQKADEKAGKSGAQALYNRLKAKQEEKTGVGMDDPALYEKAKEIVYKQYPKHSAYRSGQLVKKYKEMGGTYSGKKPKSGLTRWFKEEWKDIGNEEYPVYRPTKRITKDTPLTPDEIKPSNLKKQIALKQEIKGDSNLPPFQGGKLKGMPNEVEKRKEVMEYSDPKKALENAIKYLKKDIVFSLSTKPKKKYMVMNPDTMKWTHFGEIGYEDFLKHQDPIRKNNYLKRTANMKGNWKNDKYSANNLAREILWR